ELEVSRALAEPANRFFGDVERGAEQTHVDVTGARARLAAALRGGATERRDRAEGTAGDERSTRERDLARTAAGPSRRGLLAPRVDELRVPNAGGDERAQRRE